MQKYCSCCGFDLEECSGCGFTRDPEEEETCPNCGSDLPNAALPVVYDPMLVTEPSREQILMHFPSM